MKLRFKHQKFQAEAAQAVCDVFAGQPYHDSLYLVDTGNKPDEIFENFGSNNAPISRELTDEILLKQVQKIQRKSLLEPSGALEGHYNLTIEMETGVGKTYTYIKTMYELNKRYGWKKFIVVVPSVAVREGVYKSFKITEEHFKEEYGKAIRYFIYNSKDLTKISSFVVDSNISVMIINSQAFNAKGQDARRIYMKLDAFGSRRPIDLLAKANPILIIDEPQSVEGKQTKKSLPRFNPLFTLRYSATHKADSIYNMIYRLDAMEAYNKKLVKKIAVKGISVTGSTATESYIYLESINLSSGNPTATIEFDVKGSNKVRQVRRIVTEGFNLYEQSDQLDEYKDGFVVSRIDGRDNSIEFVNGLKLLAGDVVGKENELQLRRIQIRETIRSHFEKEARLFQKGIKVLSLFFIDEVAKYKQYDDAGQAFNGEYATIFEEEYQEVLNNWVPLIGEQAWLDYARGISADATHAGYFSIDKKSHHLVNSKLGDSRERTSDDIDAYDLIMKNKERLLSRAEPVRFIFSHSALREGWDNPNVFQICTLKQSSSDVRRRQEVGRGLRLAVDQNGDRMDGELLGGAVHDINVLTVIANESYDKFVTGLQGELAETVSSRPCVVDIALFEKKSLYTADGAEKVVDKKLAQSIYDGLLTGGYVKDGVLTDKYYTDKQAGTLVVSESVEAPYQASVWNIVDSIYDPRVTKPEDARKSNVSLEPDTSKLNSAEFKALWARINAKSAYVVDFNEQELIEKSIKALDEHLNVSTIVFRVEQGQLDKIESREQLQEGGAFVRGENAPDEVKAIANSSVKYDLIGKIVTETGLTRKAVVAILRNIKKEVFAKFANNPEEFILKASNLINEQKATVIIQHITYNKLSESYDTSIFTEPSLKGRLGENAIETKKHLYKYLIYDSAKEKEFAQEADIREEVSVYVKLPKGFYINTPVGKYAPDWAIAFCEGKVKHIYFVAETKGSLSDLDLRPIERAKIDCAKAHFKAISSNNIQYDVIDSYETLYNKVMQ